VCSRGRGLFHSPRSCVRHNRRVRVTNADTGSQSEPSRFGYKKHDLEWPIPWLQDTFASMTERNDEEGETILNIGDRTND
jgi:hypothetical protein